MNQLNVGIASYEEMKSWTLDVAAGRVKPDPDGPKLWFTTIKAVANLLTDENLRLLKIIAEQHELALARSSLNHHTTAWLITQRAGGFLQRPRGSHF